MGTSKTIFISLFIIIGLYLGLNTLLAIPQIDEDKSKTKELSLTLKEDLNSIKSTFVNHATELYFDTLTLARFDSINKALSLNNTSTSLKTSLATRILDQKIILENQIDIYYYNYLNASLTGLNAKKKGKNLLLKKYKDACSHAEAELFNNTRTIRINILRLYNFLKMDTSRRYDSSRKEYSKLLTPFAIEPVKPENDINIDSLSQNTVFRAFVITNIVVKDESQTLALIIGLIGFGLLGAIIGTFSRANSETNITARANIINSIFTTIIKSFSASIVSYLSIKGGLSILTSTTENNANPYFILFVFWHLYIAKRYGCGQRKRFCRLKVFSMGEKRLWE
jgi:hypothetical protein